MNKKKLTGWKNVFSFTFNQSIKSKSFITNTIITAVLFFALTFGVNIYSAMNERDDKVSVNEAVEMADPEEQVDNEKTDFAHIIYYTDETALGFSLEEVSKAVNEAYNSVTLVAAEKDRETMTEEMKQADPDSAYLAIGFSENGIEITVTVPEESAFKEEAAEQFADSVSSYLSQWKETRLGLNDEQKQFLSADIKVTVAGGDSTDVVHSAVKKYVPMAICLILYMSIVLYGQMVGNSVAEEKTSKVMELLLTSIRPLAVIVGKVLSMMCLAMIQLVINITILLAGNIAGASVGEKLCPTYTNTIVRSMQEYDLMSVFSPLRLLLAFVVFILGFTFFCTLAGLMGATVNRGEDLASAMSVFTSVSMIGFFLAYIPNVLGTAGTGIQTFAALFPLSSPFLLPGKILLADMPDGLIAVGIALLVVLVTVFLVIVSKVYEMVILYNGNKITLKHIKMFLKEAKTEA